MKFFLPLSNLKDGTSVLLMIHGFTGGPGAFTYLAASLDVPYLTMTLPGHGQDMEKINSVTADDMIGAVEDKVDELKKKYERVYIAGWSMGGALALLSQKADGVFLFAPAVTESLSVDTSPVKDYSVSMLNPRLVELCDSEDLEIIRYFLEKDIAPAGKVLLELRDRVRSSVRLYTGPIQAFIGKKDPCINFDEAYGYLSSIGSAVIECPDSTHAILYDAASAEVIKQANGIIRKELLCY
ncbi:MAG: alpha/beta hydrolase [Bullifex sp.]